MYYSAEHTVYSKPILSAKFIFALFIACTLMSGLCFLAYLLSKHFHLTNSIWGNPAIFSVFSFIAVLFFGYRSFTPKYIKVPTKFCNQLLEYSSDLRFHKTVLGVLRSNETIYLGDMVRIGKAIEIERKRLSKASIDLYLKHGEKTKAIERIDQQLATIRATQNFLNRVRFNYLAETKQPFLEV